jgi:hypothetical protein
MNVDKLARGELVVAAQDLNCGVKKGTLGVVFEESGYYDLDEGPVVRWFTGSCCPVGADDVSFPDE